MEGEVCTLWSGREGRYVCHEVEGRGGMYSMSRSGKEVGMKVEIWKESDWWSKRESKKQDWRGNNKQSVMKWQNRNERVSDEEKELGGEVISKIGGEVMNKVEREMIGEIEGKMIDKIEWEVSKQSKRKSNKWNRRRNEEVNPYN